MRWPSAGHTLVLALVMATGSAKCCGAATFGCGVDVGLGLAFPQYTGAIEARFAMARAGRRGLEYRHTVAAFWGETLAAAPSPGEDAHIETLVLVREWPFRSDRIGSLVSVGAGSAAPRWK